MLTQCASNPRVQPNELKVAAHRGGRWVFGAKVGEKPLAEPPATTAVPSTASLGPFVSSRVRCCRTPNDAPEAPFLRSNRRIDQNYFRFKVRNGRRGCTLALGKGREQTFE